MRYKADWSWKPGEVKEKKPNSNNDGVIRYTKNPSKNQKKKQAKAEIKMVRRMVDHSRYVPGELFFRCRPWRAIRQEAFKRHGKFCGRCHSTNKLHVDHIKPRIHFPSLQLTLSNLQVLCETCNIDKMTDYGPEHDHRIFWDEVDLVASATEHI